MSESNFPSRITIAYGLLGGALAWFLHLLLTYAIGEAACILPGSAFRFLGLSSAGWALALVSLLCAAAAFGSVIAGAKLYKHEREAVRFVGKFALFAGIIFSLAVLAQSVPLFTLLGGC